MMEKKNIILLGILAIAGIFLLRLLKNDGKSKMRAVNPSALIGASEYPSAGQVQLPEIPPTPDYMRITNPVSRIPARLPDPCNNCNCGTTGATQSNTGGTNTLADMVANLASVGITVGTA
jgi:hypothetical protein